MEKTTNTAMEEKDNKDKDANPLPAPERSYALYDISHLAYIVKDTKDILKDVLYSIGLTSTSKNALLRTAKDHIDFVSKVLEDSKDSLNGVKFRAYSDPDEVADEAAGCDSCPDEA